MTRFSFCLSSFSLAFMLAWLAPATGVAQSSPGDSESHHESVRPARSTAHERYEGAENQIRDMSRRLKMGGSGEAHRDELNELVTQAFDARQDMLRGELAEFRARLDRITAMLEAREKAKSSIIDRRVDEVLNPDLKWDANVASPADADDEERSAVMRQFWGGPMRPSIKTSQRAYSEETPGGFKTRREEKPEELARKVTMAIKAYPQLEGLTLSITPEQFAKLMSVNNLFITREEEDGNIKFSVSTDDRHVVHVMWGADGKLNDIRKVRRSEGYIDSEKRKLLKARLPEPGLTEAKTDAETFKKAQREGFGSVHPALKGFPTTTTQIELLDVLDRLKLQLVYTIVDENRTLYAIAVPDGSQFELTFNEGTLNFIRKLGKQKLDSFREYQANHSGTTSEKELPRILDQLKVLILSTAIDEKKTLYTILSPDGSRYELTFINGTLGPVRELGKEQKSDPFRAVRADQDLTAAATEKDLPKVLDRLQMKILSTAKDGKQTLYTLLAPDGSRHELTFIDGKLGPIRDLGKETSSEEKPLHATDSETFMKAHRDGLGALHPALKGLTTATTEKQLPTALNDLGLKFLFTITSEKSVYTIIVPDGPQFELTFKDGALILIRELGKKIPSDEKSLREPDDPLGDKTTPSPNDLQRRSPETESSTSNSSERIVPAEEPAIKPPSTEPAEGVNRVPAAVVDLDIEYANKTQRGKAMGIVFHERDILTSAVVLENATRVRVVFADGRILDGEPYVAPNAEGGLALISLPDKTIVPDVATVQPLVASVGTEFRLPTKIYESGLRSVFVAKVVATGEALTIGTGDTIKDLLQISESTLPGAPLLGEKGVVIGICLSDTAAIPSSRLKEIYLTLLNWKSAPQGRQ